MSVATIEKRGRKTRPSDGDTIANGGESAEQRCRNMTIQAAETDGRFPITTPPYWRRPVGFLASILAARRTIAGG
jgi:hypothetical protein